MKSRFQYIISLSENKQVLTKCHFTLIFLADNTLGYLNTAKDENSQSIADTTIKIQSEVQSHAKIGVIIHLSSFIESA